jgi:aryl-phospho-beta-D-glucosidase BglC (GH1 family)
MIAIPLRVLFVFCWIGFARAADGPPPAPPAVSQLSSGAPAATSVKITWETDILANSEIVYGPTSSYGQSATSAGLALSHSVTILGLVAGTTYHYAVISIGAAGERSVSVDHTFATTSWPLIGLNAGGQGYFFNSFAFLNHGDLAYMRGEGVSIIRVPICWEEMQSTLNEPLNPSYLSALKLFLDASAAYGIKVIVDIHGYARYQSKGDRNANGNLIGDPSNCLLNSTGYLIGSPQVPVSAFAHLWGLLASALAGQPGLGGYELMNEPHDMGNLTIWPTAAEAAIGAIRAVDAVTPIYVAGNHWQDSYRWASQNPGFPLRHPDDTNLVYAAHAYFDREGGAYNATYDEIGAYPNKGIDEYAPFVAWLRRNHVQGAATEFGAPYNDPRWIAVMRNVMTYLRSNDVLGIVHYYDTSQPGYASRWPLRLPPGSLLNAAPTNSSGELVTDAANPLMTLISEFSLAK